MMQKSVDRATDVAMLGSKSGKTIVPVPINKIQPITPSAAGARSQEKTMQPSASGSNIMDTMKTLNTSLT